MVVLAAKPSVWMATSEGNAGAVWATAVALASVVLAVLHQASDGTDLQPTELTTTNTARLAVRIIPRMASVP
jgi:hypothetical protein